MFLLCDLHIKFDTIATVPNKSSICKYCVHQSSPQIWSSNGLVHMMHRWKPTPDGLSHFGFATRMRKRILQQFGDCITADCSCFLSTTCSRNNGNNVRDWWLEKDCHMTNAESRRKWWIYVPTGFDCTSHHARTIMATGPSALVSWLWVNGHQNCQITATHLQHCLLTTALSHFRPGMHRFVHVHPCANCQANLLSITCTPGTLTCHAVEFLKCHARRPTFAVYPFGFPATSFKVWVHYKARVNSGPSIENCYGTLTRAKSSEGLYCHR